MNRLQLNSKQQASTQKVNSDWRSVLPENGAELTENVRRLLEWAGREALGRDKRGKQLKKDQGTSG